MNAIQPSHAPNPDFRPSSRSIQRRRRRVARRSHPHRALTWEVGGKLLASTSLLVFAVVGLVRLVPQTLAQQEQLEALSENVSDLEQRVDTLQSGFSDRFDPQQAQRIMQENSNQVMPGQIRVIWIEPSPQRATVPTPPPTSNP